MYFKKQHIGVVPGLKEFLDAYASDKSMGEDGYLSAKGLVPLPADMAKDAEAAAKDLKTIDAPSS